ILKFGVKTASELIGKTDFDFFPPELAAKYYADDQAVIQSGQPMINIEEQTMEHPTQQQRWLLTTKAPVRNERGEVMGLVGVGLDITGRKQAEEALRANEAKLQTFFEVLPVGVSVLNSDGQIVEMNPALERILGMSMLGILTGAYQTQEYIDRDGRPMPRSELPSVRAVVEQKVIHDVEIGVLKEDETRVWTSVSAAPLPGSNAGVITVTADITERKRAQKALQESEERFRALVQHSTDVITILAADMTVLYESPSLEKVMGYRPDAVQGLNIADVIHPDDLPLIMEKMSTILDQPAATFAVEVRLRHADGSWRLQEATVTNLLDHPAIRGIVVNSRDITERKQTEAQLATQAKLLDQVSDSIIKLDIHGIIEFWNRGSERLYGWSAEEVTGKLLAEFIQTQVVNDTMENVVRRVLETGGWNGEYVQTRKDGTSLPVLNATTLLRDGHGNLVGYVGINRDITERKQADQQALELRNERQRAQVLHQFIGDATHDLMTPIAIINSSTDLARRALTPERLKAHL
ncbi:MAG: PAS domain S-box protein, partial [Chloroflexota bacterium]